MMLLDSIKEIYISNNKPKTWEHVQEVAETAIWLAERHSLDPDKLKKFTVKMGWVTFIVGIIMTRRFNG